MKLAWKRNAPGGVKADVIYKTIKTIMKQNGGTVLPEQLILAAKPKSSPLHGCFTWNDTLAAQKYREVEARYILRNIVIIADNEDEEITTRALVNVSDEDDQSCYATIQTVLADDDMYQQLLRQAKKEMVAFTEKYSQLKELRQVFDVINTVVKKVG